MPIETETSFEFLPCITCRYDKRTTDGHAICGMFGWYATGIARGSERFCGRHGDGWAPKLQEYGPASLYERVIG